MCVCVWHIQRRSERREAHLLAGFNTLVSSAGMSVFGHWCFAAAPFLVTFSSCLFFQSGYRDLPFGVDDVGTGLGYE